MTKQAETRTGTPGAEVNGWPVIEEYLKLRHHPQNALARTLAVSRSAITQMKHGSWQLDAGQLARVCAFLDIPETGLKRLLTLVVNARLPGFNLEIHAATPEWAKKSRPTFVKEQLAE